MTLTSAWLGGELASAMARTPLPTSTDIALQTVPCSDLAAVATHAAESTADVVVLSVAAGYEKDLALAATDIVERTSELLHQAIEPLLSRGATTLLLMPSTLVEARAARGTRANESKVFHARNLATIQVAATTGVSVIDMDRLVAERGGSRTIEGPLRYSEELLEAGRGEVVRVLGDHRMADTGGVGAAMATAAQADAGWSPVVMPALGPTLERFQIVKWHKKPSEAIEIDEVLCTMSVLGEHRAARLGWRERRKIARHGITEHRGEQAHVSVVAREPGVFVEALNAVGETIAVGDTIATCDLQGESGAFFVIAELEREKVQ